MKFEGFFFRKEHKFPVANFHFKFKMSYRLDLKMFNVPLLSGKVTPLHSMNFKYVLSILAAFNVNTASSSFCDSID